MSFSNTQLIKNMISQNNFMSSQCFYDVINPQKLIKYDIFKYAINKKT